MYERDFWVFILHLRKKLPYKIPWLIINSVAQRKILVPKGKRALGRTRCRWEDDNRRDLRKI